MKKEVKKMKTIPICLDDEQILYVSEIPTSGEDSLKDIKLSKEDFKKLLEPINSVWNMMKEQLDTLNSTEITMEVNLAFNIQNGNLAFMLVKSSAQAQFSLKFVWKK